MEQKSGSNRAVNINLFRALYIFSPGIIVTPLAIDEFNGLRGDFYKNMFAKCPAGRPVQPTKLPKWGITIKGECPLLANNQICQFLLSFPVLGRDNAGSVLRKLFGHIGITFPCVAEKMTNRDKKDSILSPFGDIFLTAARASRESACGKNSCMPSKELEK